MPGRYALLSPRRAGAACLVRMFGGKRLMQKSGTDKSVGS